MNSSGSNPSSSGFKRGRFATTSWSMVVRAADANSMDARRALETLCEGYWYPLYAFVRRKGFSAETAEDLTQAFFAYLLENNSLVSAERERGRFRTFLLCSLGNYLKNHWRAELAQKRGGKFKPVAIDFGKGEARYQQEPSHELTPEHIFDRSWAMTLLGSAIETLQQQYVVAGKGDLFQRLKPYLAGQGSIAYRELAQELKISEGSLKVAVHRMRTRCKDLLRERISETVETSEQIDDEINDLFAIFAN